MSLVNDQERIESMSAISFGLLMAQAGLLHWFSSLEKELFVSMGNNYALVYIAVFLMTIGVFIKPIGNIIAYVWLLIGKTMGWINSKILLTIIFFLILTPFAILFRIFTNDPLGLKKKESSYFIERNHTYTGKDLDNIW
jgi:hypothetical protein